MDEDDLFLAYVAKAQPTLRNETMKRRMIFDGMGTVRLAKTWEECEKVCDEYVREGKNLAALKGRGVGQVYAADAALTTSSPAVGVVGSGSRRKTCGGEVYPPPPEAQNKNINLHFA